MVVVISIDNNYVPKYHSDAFHCPRCSVLVPHRWFTIKKRYPYEDTIELTELSLEEAKLLGSTKISFGKNKEMDSSWKLDLSWCSRCKEYTVWENKRIIYPFITTLPLPHEDMFEDVKEIYTEATGVFKHSPRAAAALLRLAIETMIPYLEDYDIKKGSLNNMIGELVKKGIPEHVQQGLDAIRVYGNEGIHPGEIALEDNDEIVMFLFELINIMVEELITKKRKIKSFYDKLPLGKLQGITNRDKV